VGVEKLGAEHEAGRVVSGGGQREKGETERVVKGERRGWPM